MSTHVRIVLCTVPSEEVGLRLAHALLEERLAACVNLLPHVRSIYRYEGKLEDDRELLLVIKTSSERFETLNARLVALHPYDVCEVLAIDVAAGSQAYLDWVLRETSPA